MTLSQCKYPGCEYMEDHRPYSKVRGAKWAPSCSQISGLVDNGKSDAMPWASSLIAATTAVHEPDRWTHMSIDGCTHEKDGLCAACKFLRYEFKVQWDLKRDRGTHIHHLALQWARGEDIDVDPACEPYMDAVEGFYTDLRPEWIEMERTILYDQPWSHAYRGQFDGICRLNCPTCGGGERCKWLIDWKSGNFYPTEQTLQISGYRFAQHLTKWVDGVETITGPVPAVAHAGVVMLGGDGRYRLVDLPANGDAHGTFLRLRDALGWTKTMDKWAKDHRLEPVTDDKKEKAA